MKTVHRAVHMVSRVLREDDGEEIVCVVEPVYGDAINVSHVIKPGCKSLENNTSLEPGYLDILHVMAQYLLTLSLYLNRRPLRSAHRGSPRPERACGTESDSPLQHEFHHSPRKPAV